MHYGHYDSKGYISQFGNNVLTMTLFYPLLIFLQNIDILLIMESFYKLWTILLKMGILLIMEAFYSL